MNNLRQNIMTIEDAYEIYKSTLSDNLKFFLNENEIYHIHKYIDFEQINRLYLINKENINDLLDGFIKKLTDKNFIKEYELDNYEIDENKIINN